MRATSFPNLVVSEVSWFIDFLATYVHHQVTMTINILVVMGFSQAPDVCWLEASTATLEAVSKAWEIDTFDISFKAAYQS